MPPYKQSQGFTLVEILIALFIFSVTITIVGVALHQILEDYEQVQKNHRAFTQLERFRLFMLQDFSQIIGQKPLVGQKDRILFSRRGPFDPLAHRRQIFRITYDLKNHQIVRGMRVQHLLHQNLVLPPIQRTLLSNVQAIQFRYLNDQNRFSSHWNKKPPKAMEVSLIFNDQKAVTWLF